ncbi:MAG: hypothetical protein K6E67_10360 [Prevotella sp.]|nr:hypothetical protein [Prevotella sp.]
MSQSTWHNTINGMYAATHDSYMSKSTSQRNKREVQAVMTDMPAFCQRKQTELREGTYRIGRYRHFRLHDSKKERDISVLPYEDRCVQNSVKDSFQPLVLRQMTDDMLGGLPGCGVLAKDPRHQVVEQMREALNDHSLRFYLQGDISKFYDNVDNVISMQLIEKQVKDKRTLALIRQHLFNQKKLAIGDPFSHLIANLNMSVVIRKAKAKYGKHIRLINFADDFIAFAKDKETLEALRRDMRIWAREMRLKYKPMYVRPVCCCGTATKALITFCGFQFGSGFVKLTQRTKKKYIKARHRERSMGSYNGILQVADTKHLRQLIERGDNKQMTEKSKIRRPFAGRPMKIETLEGIPHTIVDMQEKTSKQKDSDKYFHIQAIADGLGLIVYSTGSSKICEYLSAKTKHDLPLRDMKIVHDWSGYYFDGTVYTDAEEEEMIRKQFNIPKNV